MNNNWLDTNSDKIHILLSFNEYIEIMLNCFRLHKFLLNLLSNILNLTTLHVSNVKRPSSGHSILYKYKLDLRYIDQYHGTEIIIMDT